MADQSTVFLSYATPDRERVIPFYEFLLKEGLRPWMDSKEILPGQHWEFEIRKAIDAAALIVIFISANSVDRAGYVQKELRLALGKLQEKPLHHIYVIPLILDRGVEVPSALNDLNWLYADREDALRQLSQAIVHQLERLGVAQTESRRESEIDVSFGRLQEVWEGLPGYDIDISWPILSSRRYPHVSQVGEIIKGRLLSAAASHRAAKLSQTPDVFTHGQDRFIRTDMYHVECRDPVLRGSVLSQHVSIHWYGAGAMHPNLNFRTWVFLLDPLIQVDALEDCFLDPSAALPYVQGLVRQQLVRVMKQSAPEGRETGIDEDWVSRGTAQWSDLKAFTFEDKEIVIAFAPYQVASYADGPQFARVGYGQIVHLMGRVYTDALNISYLTHRIATADAT